MNFMAKRGNFGKYSDKNNKGRRGYAAWMSKADDRAANAGQHDIRKRVFCVKA